MFQRTFRIVLAAFLALSGAAACDRAPAAGTGGIVSLSPAATDLLLAMGLEKELVGVSTFDDDPRVSALPKVGDYENVDWERIGALSPRAMIVQVASDRMPAGFRERAAELGVTLHACKIDRFADILVEAGRIGDAVKRPEQAERAVQRMREQVEAVKAKLAGRPPVRTLIVTTDETLGVAGPETFLDEMLGVAGGVNVLGADRSGYSKLDRELLIALAPEAIVHISPGATPARREAIDRLWRGEPNLPAVKNGRVYVVVEPWALMPGSHVGPLAERIARHLHPEAF